MGSPWVRFRIANRDGQGPALERPLVRETTIQRHFGKRQRRPVVKPGVCVGDLYREVQVNLVNRSGFIYPDVDRRMFMKKRARGPGAPFHGCSQMRPGPQGWVTAMSIGS